MSGIKRVLAILSMVGGMVFLPKIAWLQPQTARHWYFGAGGGSQQSLYYCGAAKQKLNSSFSSRDSYFFQVSVARDLCNVSHDAHQSFRLGGQMAYKCQNAYFYYEQMLDTIVPTGTEQKVSVLHFALYPQWAFGDKVRFLFYLGPNLEYVLGNSSTTVQLVRGEQLKSEKRESDEIAGFSLGGVLGIGVEIPLTSSLCLGFQNSYTSGYTSKSGSLKKMFNYYNCFDINLLLSLIYAIPVHDR